MPSIHSNPSSQGCESCKNIIDWQPVWWQALVLRSKWLWPSEIGPGNTGRRVVIYASSNLLILHRAPMRNAVCISIFNGWQLWSAAIPAINQGSGTTRNGAERSETDRAGRAVRGNTPLITLSCEHVCIAFQGICKIS